MINRVTILEYVGYIKNEDAAFNTLKGKSIVCEALSNQSDISLNFTPEEQFAHPVYSTYVETNDVVVKVIKKRKKGSNDEFEYHYHDIIGLTKNTVKFRELADFQHLPEKDSEPYLLNKILLEGNIDEIEKVNLDKFSEWACLGPPVYSRSAVPMHFGYETNKSSQVYASDNQKYAAVAVDFEVKEIPLKYELADPSLYLQNYPDLVKKLQSLFEQRKVWTRSAILKHFEEDQRSHVKKVIVIVAYYFRNGAFRNCWVVFGYDPRKNPAAKYYQTVELRNILAAKVRSENKGKVDVNALDSYNETIKNLIDTETSTSVSQLIDLKEGPMRQIVIFPFRSREICDLRDGFFAKIHMEAIRMAMREFFANSHIDDETGFVEKWTKYIVENDKGDLEPSQFEKIIEATGKQKDRLIDRQINELMDNLVQNNLSYEEDDDYDIFSD